MYKKLSASNPHQSLCPWTPLGGSALRPRLGSRSARSPWSASPFGKSWIRHCAGPLEYHHLVQYATYENNSRRILMLKFIFLQFWL